MELSEYSRGPDKVDIHHHPRISSSTDPSSVVERETTPFSNWMMYPFRDPRPLPEASLSAFDGVYAGLESLLDLKHVELLNDVGVPKRNHKRNSFEADTDAQQVKTKLSRHTPIH